MNCSYEEKGKILLKKPLTKVWKRYPEYDFKNTLIIDDSHLKLESNNENNTSIAITGDDVILTFLPAEPLLIDSIIVTIAGEDVTLIQDSDSYVATLTLSGDEPG